MVNKYRQLYVGLLVFMTTLIAPRITLASEQVSVSRRDVLNVAKELHPPGCTDSMTADYCTLSTAYETRAEIRGLLEQGMTKQEVIDALVQKYGERILASPTTEGFNLIPWVTPAVAIVLGALLVGFFVSRLLKGNKETAVAQSGQSSLTKEEQAKLDEELKNWM
ncbi:cytochrome c-type biogenesis protein [Aquibacillus salsiterrae]|uniref:Cytochrome c-type biogenesis protein n=1 Tax=Aquibacillus salsiterrae TaxID=2950439 RepID=A0A9X4AFQ2_9BACI|nr:cytochrome c-type biogenesis protein [Aquibacillus salsiterrae]MDC3418151.1 cytochrome c-type biogenesis protein CcmH [Aquibacillus salsiterrae]